MAPSSIPKTMRQIMVKTLGTDFRKCTEIVEVDVPEPGPQQVLLKIVIVGVNASDVLATAGFHHPPGTNPPFPAGLEAIGEAVSCGEKCRVKIGEFFAIPKVGCYSEYMVLDEESLMPSIPSCEPAYVSISVSGTTASIAFEKKGQLKCKDKVLITGAAGATGQFAVQIAKYAGCHVIGTCSSNEKVEFLKRIGCDRPINYTKESLDAVLQKEYPDGVDVVYEGVGKEMFDIALKNLAPLGRLIVVGAMSGYDSGPTSLTTSTIPIGWTVIQKSADIRGFLWYQFLADVPRHITKLSKWYESGKIKIAMDNGSQAKQGPFQGLEAVYDAVDYLFAKKNTGKVYVTL